MEEEFHLAYQLLDSTQDYTDPLAKAQQSV